MCPAAPHEPHCYASSAESCAATATLCCETPTAGDKASSIQAIMASSTMPPSLQQKTDAASECSPDDADDEEEEEEQLVLVELTGIIDSDILEKCNNKCKILGINTEKPFLQVDKYVFAGEYEDALGTCVIFEEMADQDGESTKPKLKYKCHTVKKLNMTRTFLTEKKEGDDGGGKIEWFQIKDDSSASWPQMICSFAQENEDAGESQSEDDDHGQLDVSNEEAGQVEQSFYSDGKQNSSDTTIGSSESEHLDIEKVDSNILVTAQDSHSAEEAASTQQDGQTS